MHGAHEAGGERRARVYDSAVTQAVRSQRVRVVGAAGAVALFLALTGCGGGGAGSAAEPEAARDPAACAELASEEARPCYVEAFTAALRDEEDPRPGVEAIADQARATGGFLLPNCHGIMHSVGRAYAEAQDVSLERLMDYLPQANDPGCPAGFAHGLVTAVAPDIDPGKPGEAAATCADAGTRYQRYSCVHGFGHAFMRLHGDELEPALAMCEAVGEQAPDCAQGAFHDYWFAVVGVDDAELPGDSVTDPRVLCAGQESQFVRPCWYRAFVDSRPEGFEVARGADVEELCTGLAGVQREGCVTAASVIGPPDPARQLVLCAELAGTDVQSCIHGAKMQNLIGSPLDAFVETIGVCDVFGRRDRAECYRWIARTSSVVTDGEFGRAACPRLPRGTPRGACEAGARETEAPLITFS